MAIKKRHRLLWATGIAVGGFAAYEYLWKPWQAQQAALAALATGGATTSGGTVATYYPAATGLPSATSMLTDPNSLVTVLPGQISAAATGVVTSLGPQYGGALGACIAKKGGTWSPTQCQTRLDQLVAGYQQAATTRAQLMGQAANGNIASLQQLLDANQTALSQSQANLITAQQAGDTAGQVAWATAIAGHQADINAIQAKIAADPGNANNAGAIAAYEGQMAANDQQYFTLTGTHLG